MSLARNLLRAFGAWWDNLVGFLFCSTLWFLLQLTIVAAPAATMALFSIANQVADRYPWMINDFLSAFWQYFRRSLLWGLANLLLLALLLANFLLVELQGTAPLLALLWRLSWASLLLCWLMVHSVLLPFFFLQKDKRLRTAYRNSLTFAMRRPFAAFAQAIVILLVGIFASLTIVPYLFGVPLWLATWLTHNVSAALQQATATATAQTE